MIYPMKEESYSTILNNVYDAIIIHDLEGNILNVNKRMLELYEIDDSSDVKNMSVKDLSTDDNQLQLLPNVWSNVVAGENQIFPWKAKSFNSRIFDVEVYLTRIVIQQQYAIMATIRDISERIESQELIRYLYFHDKLTGLYNRGFFEEELVRLDTARQLPISIIIGDVNGLKLANDAFGHTEGDKLLKKVAEVLVSCSRAEDIVARWGGDEFAIILPKTDSRAAEAICNRILSKCHKSSSKPIVLSISLGSATKTNKNQSIYDIINDAETMMYNSKLKEGPKHRKRIIEGLLKMQQYVDHNTDIMARVSISLGKAYGLDEKNLDKFKLLAKIHDIGKVAIPKRILNNPDKLTPKEWEIVKKHSEIGYRIASTYKEYVHVAEEILSHHERWDGLGYPRGLKGDEICIGGRILAIADAYEVMVSGRPYKKAKSHQEALEEIKSQAGKQFDPKLVELFLMLDFD